VDDGTIDLEFTSATFSEVRSSPIWHSAWKPSGQKELDAVIIKHKTFQPHFFKIDGKPLKASNDPLPGMPSLTQSPPIDIKSKHKSKLKADGTLKSRKTRVVARGFKQVKDVNFFETYSGTVHPTTIKLLIAIATARELDLYHIDVTNAFVHAPMLDIVYSQFPEGYDEYDTTEWDKIFLRQLIMVLKENSLYQVGDEHLTIPQLCAREQLQCYLRIAYSLYGTVQAGHNWEDLSSNVFINDLQLRRTANDPQFFIKDGIDSLDNTMYIGKLTDDILIATKPNTLEYNTFVSGLSRHYNITQELVTTYNGINITRGSNWTHLNLQLMTNNLVKKFNLNPLNKPTLPMPVGTTICKSQCPSPTDTKPTFPYASAVMTTNFIVCMVRPDTAHVQSMLASVMANPSEAHVKLLKHFMSYLVNTSDVGIKFTRTGDPHIDLRLNVWSDTDMASDIDTRHCRECIIMQVCGGTIYFCSRLQPHVSLSVCEGERCCRKGIFTYRIYL